ncbi:MAG: hypothetical protein NVSMB58_35380 [Terriglobales bacterium]
MDAKSIYMSPLPESLSLPESLPEALPANSPLPPQGGGDEISTAAVIPQDAATIPQASAEKSQASAEKPQPRKRRTSSPLMTAEQRVWFEEYWNLYPRKQGKLESEKWWAANVTTQEQFDEIMAGLRRQLPELLSRPPNMIPMPLSWLNGRRWNDQQLTAAANSPPIITPKKREDYY